MPDPLVVPGEPGVPGAEPALPSTLRTVEGDRITSACSVCGDSVEAPNKGLGRATVAAWETNHGRNCDV